ncbi:restriction endonuclease subunit S [Pseudoalteromonas prydzensis]|uniref:restriction endonuclease subunit S n=1 Tax=Pseudoalteromonas prydzensis TaxID=182141 RepID=UPI0024BCD14A|nr:restriction endonuclease subunit S [Pseudoalteromonas prydzensis]
MSGVRTVLLKDICNFEKGTTGLMKAIPGEYPLVTTGANRRTCESYQFDTKAVCIPLVSSTGHGHASLNNIHYQEGRFALGTILVALTAKDEAELDVHFLHLYLSQLKDVVLVPLMKGAANVSLSITAIKCVEIPLPSIVRQKEIVEKFKSIVNEENQLLEELNKQGSLIQSFREQIFKEAIDGRLSATWREQFKSCCSIDELLENVQVNKELAIDEGNLRIPKNFPQIKENEIPYSIPKGWRWCRIGDLAAISSGKGFTKSEYTEDGVRLFQIANVSFGRVSWDKKVFVPEEYMEQHPNLILKAGDILMALNRPLLGKKLKVAQLGELDVPSILYQRVGKFELFDPDLASWLYIYLQSPNFSSWLYEQVKGVNIPFVNQTKVYTHLIPIPPLEEQHEIKLRLERLIDRSEQLELQVNSSQYNTKILIRAVLNEEFSHDL